MNNSTHAPSKALVMAAFAAIYIIWGSTYLGILLAIKTIPPLMMAGTRFLIAGLLLLSWGLLKGERIPTKKSVAKIALAGILLLVIGNGAVAWVEQYLPSGLAAIIVATVPLWMVLIDRRHWNYYFTNKQILFGLCIGFVGVILLFAGKSSADLFSDKAKFISLLILIAGTLSWTIGSLYIKYQQIQGSTLMKVAVQMMAAGIVLWILAFAFKEPQQFQLGQVTGQSVGALVYLILFGSIVAYLAYMWLLSVRPASVVGTYAYVNPAVAVFLGWLIAHETISIQKVIGLCVIIAGLFIVNTSGEKKKAAA